MKSINSSRTSNKSYLIKQSEVDLKNRFDQACILNKKLHQLFEAVKNNTHAKGLQHSQNQSILGNTQKQKVKKIKQNLEIEVQHMMRMYNGILSENKKLKEEVNERRKQRVIYSNIFKRYQKDIRIWKDTYQKTLLDNLIIADSSKKIIQKLTSIKKVMQKSFKNQDVQNSSCNILLTCQKSNNQSDPLDNQIRVSRNQMKKDQISSINDQAQQKMKKKNYEKEKRNQSIQNEYEEESKAIFYQSVMKKLKEITKIQDPRLIKEFVERIDSQTQDIFNEYSFLENQNIVLQQQIESLEKQLHSKFKQTQPFQSPQNVNQYLTQLKSNQTIIQLEKQFNMAQDQCKQLQKLILQKVDLNCEHLTNQEITQYIKHFINKGNTQNQALELQNSLKRIQKEKSVDQYLVNFSQ